MKKIQTRTNINAFVPSDSFIGRYQKCVMDVVLPYQYSIMCDKEAGAEKSHVVANFANAAKALHGSATEQFAGDDDGFYGMVFQDSDLAKWLEGVAYALALCKNPTLEAKADALIALIAKAQDSDGYLNTYFTIKDREKRWTNLHEAHELYCAGHMMEAASAYYLATKKDLLLNVMKKNADHIYNIFMDKSSHLFYAYPGHPEIERGLIALYRATNNERYLELARHFVDIRGVNANYFLEEKNRRNWTVWNSHPDDGTYAQNAKPVRQQTDATGHAVRAVYLYDAMADIASETADEELFASSKRLWKSITQKRMYITGGIGSTVHGEAFSVDYNLPTDTAYCETCASIGLFFFASKMLEAEICNEYGDVMERAFYNTVLAGMQLDGKKFFYVNPLEVIPGIAGVAQTHKHDLPERPKWYACACCPPNVARLITSFSTYAYGESKDALFCHLYLAGTVTFANGTVITCQTEYPFDFNIKFTVQKGGCRFAVRIPSWSSKNCSIAKNGAVLTSQDKSFEFKDGYVFVDLLQNDELLLKLDSSPYAVYPSTKIPDLSGTVAICRGPLVYCVEGIDNEDDVLSLQYKDVKNIKVVKKPNLFATLPQLDALCIKGVRLKHANELYSTTPPVQSDVDINAIPYFTWANRAQTQMRVWLPLASK